MHLNINGNRYPANLNNSNLSTFTYVIQDVATDPGTELSQGTKRRAGSPTDVDELARSPDMDEVSRLTESSVARPLNNPDAMLESVTPDAMIHSGMRRLLLRDDEVRDDEAEEEHMSKKKKG